MQLLLRPSQSDPLNLAAARVHEVGVPSRRAFAVMQAAQRPGPVIWITPAHIGNHLMPWNLPQRPVHRILQLRARSEDDLMWLVEECLRSGSPALVIAEPQKPLSLTAGRRLQLAAEAAWTTVLMLIREGGV